MPNYVAADGMSLHYDVSGQGGPIVTLAGGAARHPSYLGDLAGLSGLVVPHLRGVGKSPSGAGGSSWAQASDVDSLRTHLAKDRLVIVAHSAGTRLAIAYAAQFPSRVERLVLITPPSAYLVSEPSDAPKLIDARRGEPAFDAAIAAFEAGPDLSGDDAFNAWNRATAPVGYAKWTATEQRHAQVGRWNLAAVQAYFSVQPPADLASRLREVTAPTLVVAGERDCLTGLAPVVALADLFPHGEVAVIEDCGHYPWIEQPAAFRQAVDEFLARPPQT
ncbi:alpha/beta fold hydrolase [Kibdelosporangium persicum]|uniref:Pimeloyl-ACP methyl ester carboxylesterase n=1 Tax=Kibdelosporangium persicum TaxID=2698649 RepID=A0ABX2EZS6_9PSEU|nr:alpha/beta hydrolase [Kibdelosporangium persicum]NRN64280.1 Pimeloyl-ACP methyl ester carboxylesterase [Kibdelosporangium persicum]